MNTTEIRALTDADLDLVSGGADPNYKFCWNGPAGTGTYPNYVDCGPTWDDLVQIIVDTANKGKQIQQGGGRPK